MSDIYLLYETLLAEPKTGVRPVLADALEEAGRFREAAWHRWLAQNEDVIHDGDRNPEDPWSWPVQVDIHWLPDGMLSLLPAPTINRSGGPEESASDRILLDLWLSRETAERDLLAAWLKMEAI